MKKFFWFRAVRRRRAPADAFGKVRRSLTETSQAVALASEIRRLVLTESKRANVGHIGSCLSVAEILAALYGGILRVDSSDDRERDRFILSKGHAGLALYAALAGAGHLDRKTLETFCEDGAALGTHPESTVDWIDFSTGSLGHGLAMGAGAALAARMQRSGRRVFVLVSDAECNEGSLWEAVMFAAHHELSNLVAIVDLNGQQALGYTEKVLSLSPLDERFSAFGWDVVDVDGHDVNALFATIGKLDTASGAPHALIAHTVFGKGVSYMEHQIAWHYLPLSDEQFARALAEVGAES